MAQRTPDQFILGVDLDGVVADHTRRFRDILADIRGVDPEIYPLQRSWDFGEWDLGPDEYADYHRIAVMEHDMFRTMPMIEGAADALWRLSDAGVWIRIITHRLYVHWGHEKAVADTAAWLDANRIPYRDLCFLGAKPQAEANAYIDDAPHNVAELRAHGNTVIVFDQPYNAGVDGPRARSWVEVEEIVSELATAHAGRFEPQLPGFDSGSDRLDRRRGGASA
ncbi:MAG: 5' nucleotidase, NT5C type [Ilumatobacter sp.]|uniref:5' nucleotidase, NT5C type n=1 Tax=Ilumatobacter sp. TaxID=1967498 RepID=UPI00391B6F76